MSRRILVADDERDLLETLAYALRREGFEVDCVEEGEAAVAAALATKYDLLILDVLMPKLSGLEVCRRVRQHSIVPIIMLTARDAELDRVIGLEIGADDYVTKPFSVAELVSRVRAITRRTDFDRRDGPPSARTIGALEIDFVRHETKVDGRRIPLTPSEFRLLAFLADQPERVFTRRQIMEHLWDSPYVGDERACDVHVSNLRRKIERDPMRPERIVTVREVGYKLVPV